MSAVELSYGSVRGVRNADTWFFGGIPYADEPTGPRRFQPPAPPLPWNGVRPAESPGHAAPQSPCFGVIGERFGTVLPQGGDCLTLSVRTPDLGDARLPVLVWIHGGGFALGSGGDPLYQGAAFARQGVVEVCLNYRLGVDGFAFLDDPVRGRTANLGLLDQIAALTWVQDNIARFGGDPTRVTVAGHSAGAMSVACLLASPRAGGLFQQAILQSPAGPLAISSTTAHGITGYLAEVLDIPARDREALAAVLRPRLLEAQGRLSDEAFAGVNAERFGEAAAGGMAFVPVVDGDLLPDHPLQALSSGSAKGIPTLIGTTRDETMLQLDGALGGMEPPPEVGDAVLGAIAERTGLPMDLLTSAYHPDRPDASSFELAVAISTDTAFRMPTVAIASALSNHCDVYAYRYDRPTVRDGRLLGAIHGAELPFTFATDTAPGRRLAGDYDPGFASVVNGGWVAFIADGRPQHASLPSWPCYELPERSTMLLDPQGSYVVEDPGGRERQLWEEAALGLTETPQTQPA